MAGQPNLASIVPHLVVPALLALLVLLWARRLGASWTQVHLSFGAAMLGAFLTAAGWIFAAYIAGETLTPLKILGSQLLVATACGLAMFFGAMPIEQDLTDELKPKGSRGSEG